MIKLLEQRPIMTIIVVVATMLLPFLDVLEVSIMEARNFITAREMLTDGNWILTTMNGEPRYQKPPLPTWFSAISATVFGVKSVWGMRFPAVLMVMLLGSMVYSLSRKLPLTKRHSLINGLVSVTSLYVVLIIFEGPWDIYAHAFMIAGIYFLYCYLNPSAKGESQVLEEELGLDGNQGQTAALKKQLLIAGALYIGASVLSKGPVSLYVLLIPFLLAYLIVYRKVTAQKKWFWIAVTVIFGMGLGFSWYAYVRYIDPLTFEQITTKETSNWTSYNVRPFYYYWSFFIQSGLWVIPAFVSLLYPYMKSRVCHLKAYQFTFLWTVIAVVLLSVIPEKKSRYLMPVLIPLALNIGFYVEYLVRRFKELNDWRETTAVYVNFSVLGVAFVFLPFVLVYFIVFENYVLEFFGMWCVLLLWMTSAVLLFNIFKKNIYSTFLLVIVGVVLVPNLLLSFVKDSAPLVSKNYELSGLMLYRSFDGLQDLPVYGLDGATPEMVWEYGQNIPILFKNEELTLPLEQSFYILEYDTEESLSVAETITTVNVGLLGVIDLNGVGRDSKDYKDRRVAKVFVVER